MKEKLKKGKIQLQTRNSFFGRLILSFNFEENNNIDTIGVEYNGKCYYNKSFIERLTINELVGVLAHELFHMALLHHFRMAGNEPKLSNIAQDITINSMLVKSNFVLPEIQYKDDNGQIQTAKGLIPKNDEISLNFGLYGEIVIKECSKKNAETIYAEIIKQLKNKGAKISSSDDKFGDVDITISVEQLSKRLIDKHSKIEKMTKKERKKAQKQIESLIREAMEHSKMRGDTPLGLERLWGELHKEKFNWKILLQRYITDLLPYDQSWSNFGKKTYGTGIYSPMTLREQINVTVAIDVSGSISDKDLTNFMSEIVGVANQFKNRIKMTIITHEDKVLDTFNVFNDEDVKNIKIKGCGGTSFKPVVEYVKQNIQDTKCLVWLTDGEGEEKLNKQPFTIIWILTEDGDDKLCNESGRVLWLKDTINKD